MIKSDTLQKILAKYDVPGPRYTSYPTVPAWSNEIKGSDYIDSLSALSGDEPLSLYFHLPFCENLCHFCGCTQVITKDHSLSAEYVDYIKKEVEITAEQLKNSNKKVVQIHFGGGTPNFLKPEELTDIFNSIHKHFDVREDSEIAIEMHPRTSTEEFCDNLAELGFNRISLGVQDFDPIVQKKINRHQTYDMTKEMVDYLRNLGFDSFNFDLVYGLPAQSKEGWKDTLEKTNILAPQRLAVYSYAHVPWTRPGQRGFTEDDLPSAEQKLEYFDMAYQYFTNNGYKMIGMDHFAVKDDELTQAVDNSKLHRNFMGYTTKSDAHQIGFGMSAISYVAGNYFQNLKKLREYKNTIKANEFATFRGIVTDKDDRLRRKLINELMCNRVIDLDELSSQFDINAEEYFSEEISELEHFISDGMLEKVNGMYKVTDEGILCVRNIAMVFDKYLKNLESSAKNPIFSKTV